MLGPVSPPSPWVDTDGRLDTLTALLSRTFRPEQRAIVKATSFTSEIARRLIPPASHTLFLFATPVHYIENILAGEHSRKLRQIVKIGRASCRERVCKYV